MKSTGKSSIGLGFKSSASKARGSKVNNWQLADLLQMVLVHVRCDDNSPVSASATPQDPLGWSLQFRFRPLF